MTTIARTIQAAVLGLLVLASAPGCRRSATPPPAAFEAVNRGVSLMGQYDYEGATQAFEEALAAAPDNARIQVNLAIARFNRGRKEDQDIERATALLDSVLERDAEDLHALYFKGIILQHLGHADQAIPCLEKTVQLSPNDGVGWYVLGLCKQRVGQDARKELLRAIELRPYLASAYYRVWQTLQAAGETEQAAPYLEQFKKLREHPLAETIELPQYNQMGDLALVMPLEDPTPQSSETDFAYRAGPPRVLLEQAATAPAGEPAGRFGGVALLDTNRDGTPELIVTGWPGEKQLRALQLDPASDRVAPVATALDDTDSLSGIAIGDYDNDGVEDLFAVTDRGWELYHGTAGGGLERTTDILGIPAGLHPRSALWLDADHDGDLDLFLCNASGPDQLLNNNADPAAAGFTDITAAAGLVTDNRDSIMVLPGDLDGDRDMDLVVLRADAPARIFLNELSGRFREIPAPVAIRGDLGGVLEDFNGDDILDLLTLGNHPALPALHLGDGRAGFRPSSEFRQTATAAAVFGTISGIRVADLDLDGDLDVCVFGEEGHALLNDGTGHFTLQGRLWQPFGGTRIIGAEVMDVTGDLVPDVLLIERGVDQRIRLIPGEISPRPTALSLAPTGIRSRDKRTRSPASGYGVRVVVRSGQRGQARWHTGQAGGFVQSPAPLVVGLAGAQHADYVRLHWPDSVIQVERALPAGRTHTIAESQRKVSSCPVLFTWNGRAFEFITDFAGVGGLGYFVAPGEYAYPQPVDHVKIEPHQLEPRDGLYHVRITEPMEESSYVDRLQLLAIDHPAQWRVFPDERLTVTGPAPTHELLVIDRAIPPLGAATRAGVDCTEALRAADRRYAFEPTLDRRFIGFSEQHVLELNFGNQLAGVPQDTRLFLFITGYLEYPYSQTTFAAGQAGLGWEPIRIDRQQHDGSWQTIVPDAGALGGMARTMTVDLTGLATGPECRLRLISNLEIYYDQVFVAAPLPAQCVTVHTLPVADAELRYSGFAREVTPDGLQPTIYDYEQSEPDAPFRSLRGAYTRYGPVRELLAADDDIFVLMASGDEIAASFDATRLPDLPAGMARSFVLVSHAYCKDMDNYTGTPETLEPMPFRGMARYPYPADDRPAETDEQRRVRETYETRIVE